VPLKRLYVVTGKGGVGKTVFSLALAKHLKSKGHKVVYNSLDQDPNTRVCRDLEIPTWQLTLEESARIYIGKKLGSDTIASWIMKTPFFISLFNMIPGLGQMIFFGHIVKRLQDEPNLHIVIDSPSTGHALTMFESPLNFKEMFGNGLIVDDINEMLDFIAQKNALKTIILALPTYMSTNEGFELKETLLEKGVTNLQIIINDSLKNIPNINVDNLPNFLQKKCQGETTVIDDLNELEGTSDRLIIPHFSTLEFEEMVLKFIPYIEEAL
jgi:anion-transporting  ArsA/GET3 family ATPase